MTIKVVTVIINYKNRKMGAIDTYCFWNHQTYCHNNVI